MSDSTTKKSLKQSWKENGYVLIRNIFSNQETKFLLHKTQEISGLKDEDFEDVLNGQKNHFVDTDSPLVSRKEFWPFITNRHILEFIRRILDENICFLGGDGIFVHRSAHTLHRDSFIDDDTLAGPDFDPSLSSLLNVRATTYLKPTEMIVVPGSHRRAYPDRNRLKFKEFEDLAIFIAIEPEDILIFDSMLLHAGRYLTAPKYQLVWNYSSRNKHTIIAKYYSQIVTSAHVRTPSPEFSQYLMDHNLFWEELYSDEKYLKHFEHKWREMPKHDNSSSQKKKEGKHPGHWSPYLENLY